MLVTWNFDVIISNVKFLLNMYMLLFLDITSVKAIKDALPYSIDYGKLNFVLAMLELNYGFAKRTNSKEDSGVESKGKDNSKEVCISKISGFAYRSC